MLSITALNRLKHAFLALVGACAIGSVLSAARSTVAPRQPFDASPVIQSARDSASHSILRRVMDQFNEVFSVYEDVSSAGNHFHAWAKIRMGRRRSILTDRGPLTRTGEPRRSLCVHAHAG